MTDRKLMQQALEALDRVISHAQEAEDILLAALSEGTEQLQRTHWEGCEEVHPECKQPGQDESEAVRAAWMAGYTEGEREAIENQTVQQQEPVASVGSLNEFSAMELVRRGFALTDPLYTSPPRREWAGLTDDQVSAIADQHPVEGFDPSIMAFARTIEAKLREKNNV